MNNTYIEKHLNFIVSPIIKWRGREQSAFQLFGCTGLALAVLLAMGLVAYQQASLYMMVGIIMAAVATFLVLAMITKIILGEERLIYYHHEIAIMNVTALVLWLLNQPVLPYLDITILGIGTFLFCGRIGCLMVGCCHGKPHNFGVCYGEEHVHAGFTPYYVGVRLFPIQLVESLWVLGTVIIGVTFILNHFPAGTTLAWYIISYDIGRFFFEFLRGDPLRLYGWGFSEGQWTSVILMLVIVWLEIHGYVPYVPWHVGATIVIIAIMVAVAIARRFQKTPKYQLLNPRHVRELAEAVHVVSTQSPSNFAHYFGDIDIHRIPIKSTSLGINVSAGRIMAEDAEILHYALSCQDGQMTEEVAQAIAKVILTIKPLFRLQDLFESGHGVYHLLLRRDSKG